MSATITAADINKLRQSTGAGMLDCRKALTESNGDFEAAIDWLRKQGQKVAAKRSDREAKEGVILAKTTSDNKTGMIVCISCETDFVSKNAEFVAFSQSIMDAAIANNVTSVEALNEVEINGAKVAELINDKLAAIGEKIAIKLNPKDINYLIESLLFASSVSVGADWKEDSYENMITLAKQLKNTLSSQLKLEHVNFFKEEYYEDSWSEEILKEFGDQLEIISLEDCKNAVSVD